MLRNFNRLYSDDNENKNLDLLNFPSIFVVLAVKEIEDYTIH